MTIREKTGKIILFTAAALVLTLAGAKQTLAYLTSRESVTNTFTVGDLDIGFQEPDWNPDDGDGKNVYPGYSVYKNPTVKNTTSSKNGEEPCYARIRILLADGAGELISDTKRTALIKKMIRYDSTYTGTFDAKGSGRNITQGRVPGYSLKEIERLPMINPLFAVDQGRTRDNEIVCNYMGADKSGILKIGEQATLFTTLALPTDWTNAEMKLLGDFQIIVKAEAIQAKGFADQASAFAALDGEIAASGISMAEEG